MALHPNQICGRGSCFSHVMVLFGNLSPSEQLSSYNINTEHFKLDKNSKSKLCGCLLKEETPGIGIQVCLSVLLSMHITWVIPSYKVGTTCHSVLSKDGSDLDPDGVSRFVFPLFFCAQMTA